MVTHTVQLAPPLAADGAALLRVLHQAGATRNSVVRVTGPAGVAAVLWLNRHGYEQAAFVQAHCVASMRPVDVLLIPHACGARELGDLLDGGDCLREGGILIVQTPGQRFVQGQDSIGTVLQSLGYQLEHHFSDKGRNVYVARRDAPAENAQAA
jgi:hypothetical protein